MVQVRSSPSGPLVGVGYIDISNFNVGPGESATTNSANITRAVALAAAMGLTLFWPDVVPTNASIPLLHTVTHVGPGGIRRGTDVFYVQPDYFDTNRIYASPTGSAANDGLSSGQPVASFQNVADIFRNYGPVLNGQWFGEFAAGSYPTLNQTFDTPSRRIVTFRGPNAGGITAVPTCFFDGTGAASSDFGARASGPGVQALFRDIKFRNYNHASTNNIGLLFDYGSDAWTYNVHVDTTLGQGIYGEGCKIVRLTGGIIDGCRQGILLNACDMVTVGYGHASAADGIVRNCTQAGIEWTRGTNGHCDFMTLLSNAVGLDVFHVSRCHLMQCALTTNTVGIRARSGGFYLNDTNVYTNNTLNWQNNADGGETDTDLWLSIQERRRAYSTNSILHTGTVAKTTLIAPWTIPQGFFCTPSGNAS